MGRATDDQRLREARLPIAATFLVGLWLIAAPFFWDYAHTMAGTAGYWNDLVVGVLVAGLALVRGLSHRGVPWLGLVNVVLGFWLISAPFVLGYETEGGSGVAKANDLLAGIVVACLAGASTIVAFRRRRARRSPAGAS